MRPATGDAALSDTVLAAAYDQGKRAAAAILVRRHGPLLARLVAAFCRRWRRWNPDEEDIGQEAAILFLRLVRAYDPDRGVEFDAFVRATLPGQLLDVLGANSALRRKRAALRSHANKLRAGETLPLWLLGPISLDATREEGGVPAATIPSPTPTPAEALEQAEREALVLQHIERLPARQADVLQRRYLAAEPKGQKEVGEDLGVSRSHVGAIEARAIKTRLPGPAAPAFLAAVRACFDLPMEWMTVLRADLGIVVWVHVPCASPPSPRGFGSVSFWEEVGPTMEKAGGSDPGAITLLRFWISEDEALTRFPAPPITRGDVRAFLQPPVLTAIQEVALEHMTGGAVDKVVDAIYGHLAAASMQRFFRAVPADEAAVACVAGVLGVAPILISVKWGVGNLTVLISVDALEEIGHRDPAPTLGPLLHRAQGALLQILPVGITASIEMEPSEDGSPTAPGHVPDPEALELLRAVSAALAFLTDPAASRARVAMVMGWDPLDLHPDGTRAALASLTEGPHGAERVVPAREIWCLLYALRAYQTGRGGRRALAFEAAGGTWAPAHAVALARYESEARL